MLKHTEMDIVAMTPCLMEVYCCDLQLSNSLSFICITMNDDGYFSQVAYCMTQYLYYALFPWLISHPPAVFFSQSKPATSNQPVVLLSQNKPAPAISHQPLVVDTKPGARGLGILF
jgi:hypothetical protein